MTCLDLSQCLKPFRWLTQGHKAVVVPIMEHVICMLHITCSKMTKSYLEEKIWIFYTCIIFRVWPFLNFNSVQFSSVTQSCPTLCDPINHGTPGLHVHHQLPEFTQTHIHRVSDAIQPSHPLSSLFLLPPIPPSIRVFSNESNLRMRWPKYWSFSFIICPSNEHPGLISFRTDWLDLLLALQGTLKSLLWHHSPKASIFRCSAFFTVQLSHASMTTGETIAFTRQTFVGKVMSLLFHMLSRLVITFLPRSKRLLTSWLQSPSAGILEPPKIKSDTVSTVS